MFKKFLLSKNINCGLLLIRVSIGLLMLFSHGLGKLESFGDKFHSFPDPLGISSELSYILVVVAEFFCSLLLAVGLFTRVTVVPLIINMVVILLAVHLHDPWAKKEFPLLFLIAYLTIFLTGPGKYSLDYWWFEKTGKIER